MPRRAGFNIVCQQSALISGNMLALLFQVFESEHKRYKMEIRPDSQITYHPDSSEYKSFSSLARFSKHFRITCGALLPPLTTKRNQCWYFEFSDEPIL